jgi:hypothetical protein
MDFYYKNSSFERSHALSYLNAAQVTNDGMKMEAIGIAAICHASHFGRLRFLLFKIIPIKTSALFEVSQQLNHGICH